MFQTLMNEELSKPEPKRNQSCWKKRTLLEKFLLIVSIVGVIIIIFLLVTLQISRPILKNDFAIDEQAEKLINGVKENKLDVTQEVCLSSSCIKVAANVLEFIDTSIKPCDDFYKFVCGSYIENAIIPDDETAITTFTTLTDQLQRRLRTLLMEPTRDHESAPITLVKNYYKACINKTSIENYGLQVLKDILNQADGWPVLYGDKWNHKAFDWKELMYKFTKIGFETKPFIDISIGTDLKNSTTRRILIDQPELGLSREFLVKGVKDKLVNAYFKYMVAVAVEMGCDKSVAETELKESLEFEINMAKISVPKEERRNISKLYNVMSIEELQDSFPSVNWLKLINNLLLIEVDSNETLILSSPEYIESLITLLNETSKRAQANYATWRAIKQQIPYLNDGLRQQKLNYEHTKTGITEEQIRWKECVRTVSADLPNLASALYIRRYFHEDAKKNAVEMVKYIKASFRNILQSLDWMDDITRKSALDKAEAIVDHIGYPDELLDDKKLEEYYKTLDVHADQYLQSHLNIQIHTNTFYAKRFREPVNKTDWVDHGSVAQVNAFYHPLENSIMFPAGILQGSFFNKDQPRYMNYAAIGSVIGHELTHGFDDTGRQFDKDGNLVDWWAQTTEDSFLEKAQCIINQYENYTIEGTTENLNGINTQGENIADNGGIKEAYLAYKTWVNNNGPEPKLPGLDYSPNQLFWISGAMTWCARYREEVLTILIATDSHSLNEFRVLGPFSNMNYFAEDFNCPVGSKMNPVHKCSVW